MSAYDKKLYLLSIIVEQDYLWEKLFLENVYFKPDRTYYGYIIDNELIKNAIYNPPNDEHKSDEGAASDASETSNIPRTKDDSLPIIPYMFIRNIVFRRFVVGSLLDLGLNLLMLSFKCLLYKHMVYLITLINSAIKSKNLQKKAASWSGKSKEVIEPILKKMGALQFTDTDVLVTLSIFDIYQMNGENMEEKVKVLYSNKLFEISVKMLNYVKDVCVVRPHDNEEYTLEDQMMSMINVDKNQSLYDTDMPFNIDRLDVKTIIKKSWERLNEVFGNTPRVDGMSKSAWYSILNFRRITEKNWKKLVIQDD